MLSHCLLTFAGLFFVVVVVVVAVVFCCCCCCCCLFVCLFVCFLFCFFFHCSPSQKLPAIRHPFFSSRSFIFFFFFCWGKEPRRKKGTPDRRLSRKLQTGRLPLKSQIRALQTTESRKNLRGGGGKYICNRGI